MAGEISRRRWFQSALGWSRACAWSCPVNGTADNPKKAMTLLDGCTKEQKIGGQPIMRRSHIRMKRDPISGQNQVCQTMAALRRRG